MKMQVKLIFLLVLIHSATVSVADSEDNAYMITGLVSGAGAAALGGNIPLVTGLGLFVTYMYINQPDTPTLEELLEDSGVEIVEDKQGTSLLLPVDMMFIGPISDPIIDVHYYNILNTVMDVLQFFPQLSIKVSGHTDNIMSPSDNFVSSDKYAWAVTNYLLGKGVSPKRIIAVEGKAHLEPVSVKNTPTARMTNRRVEITLLAKKKISFSGSKYDSFRDWAKKRK